MPYKRSTGGLRQATARRLSRLPPHCREAGVQRAEKALADLTDAAGQLNIADLLTETIVTLWNALHRGAPPPLVRHAPPPVTRDETPVLDGPMRDPTRKRKRGWRCNLERIESPEGQAMLQDVLRGLLSQRAACRRLGVSPTVFCQAVGRLRREHQRQQADAPAEMALKFG